MYKFFPVISDLIKYNQCKKAGVNKMLVSYYYLQKDIKLYNALINDEEIEIIVDSGLFSFSNSVKVTKNDAIEYANKYINFVKNNHTKKVFIGFFELDFDLIGYPYAEYQKQLLDITNKIILIMQKGRNIEEIKGMLLANIKTVAIPFASSKERNWFDIDYLILLAKSYNKRIHLLGCSTISYLIKADQSDSSSWFMTAAFGEEMKIVNNKLQTFHYTIDETVSEIYDERAIRNAKAYLEFECLVNQKKDDIKFEEISLF